MIDLALKFLAGELDTYLSLRTAMGAGQVKTCAVVDDMGKWVVPENTIGTTLVNLEEERGLKEQMPDSQYVNGRLVIRPPELRINLHVMFCARFKTYEDALQRLSMVLTFFQAHAVFQSQQFPALDPRVERLSVELLSMGYEQLNQLWAYLGGKYLPSVLYRVRMVVLQDEEPTLIAPPVLNVVTTVQVR